LANVDWQAAATTIRAEFSSQWAIRVPAARVAYRNGPKLTPLPDPESEEWVRVSILNGASEHPAIGSRRSRDLGRVEVQIFTPLGKGDGRSRELGDIVREIWDSASFSDVSLGAPEFVSGGPDSEIPFWGDVVSTPFRVERTTA
jgi:hypothetical protein